MCPLATFHLPETSATHPRPLPGLPWPPAQAAPPGTHCPPGPGARQAPAWWQEGTRTRRAEGMEGEKRCPWGDRACLPASLPPSGCLLEQWSRPEPPGSSVFSPTSPRLARSLQPGFISVRSKAITVQGDEPASPRGDGILQAGWETGLGDAESHPFLVLAPRGDW